MVSVGDLSAIHHWLPQAKAGMYLRLDNPGVGDATRVVGRRRARDADMGFTRSLIKGQLCSGFVPTRLGGARMTKQQIAPLLRAGRAFKFKARMGIPKINRARSVLSSRFTASSSVQSCHQHDHDNSKPTYVLAILPWCT